MCGISGAWLSSSPAIGQALNESLARIRHRGPDGQGVHIESDVALGMRRLSIIDLEGGHQPIWNEAHDMCVVFNGEIYNYLELLDQLRSAGHTLSSRSDTESIIHAYEEAPDDFASRLRGMFAIAIFDRRRQRLVLVRDRFGKKPLYYCQTSDGGLLFASEIKALVPLMHAAGVPVETNPQALYDFLSLGSVPQPSTAYRGVFALPPGHILLADREGHRSRAYWRPPSSGSFRGSYEDAKVLVRSKIAEAVTLRLRSDVPLGSFLSAGVDSSIVTYEAARVAGEQLHTFTVASADRSLDESGVAVRTARRYGVKNTVLHLDIDPLRDLSLLVEAYDQPFADPSAIPSMAVSKAAREHVKVVLNGDGGDELFGGYRRHVAAHSLRQTSWFARRLAAALSDALAPEKRPRRSRIGMVGRTLRGLSLPAEERYLVWTSDMLREADKRSAWRGAATPTEELVKQNMLTGKSGLDLQVATELRLNLLSSLLVKMDIATSAHSLEGRSPLLDHELGELALTLPPGFKVRNGRPKAILRDAYVDALPGEVFSGKKRGFEVPLADWLAGPWRQVFNDTVGAPDARVLDYVDRELVQRVIADDTFQDRNKAYISYSFLVLELWLRHGRVHGAAA